MMKNDRYEISVVISCAPAQLGFPQQLFRCGVVCCPETTHNLLLDRKVFDHFKARKPVVYTSERLPCGLQSFCLRLLQPLFDQLGKI